MGRVHAVTERSAARRRLRELVKSRDAIAHVVALYQKRHADAFIVIESLRGELDILNKRIDAEQTSG